MRAETGDKLVIRGHKVGAHVRHCTIVEVRGDDGGPPYVVQWEDEVVSGEPREHLFFPGSDADIEHIPQTR